ncbi:iron export ABC transporter permease subunit FetB [Romeria aff. gracilis LEGE 07310]|uniref:Iron export ABC transporter permease subunit FetB n=1 Tax=Vasconcelosia minhoensis LEGE 07310 TaxID=915328 RepID=A0A8J7AM06_9CYAN|nr:iron export ABC transporter permease subunit FetB [Romeria gracilis]MBE9080443.1 iron export ABC transporter permease subunit FetB [Romeria aff. gracilis LEGE 07310]
MNDSIELDLLRMAWALGLVAAALGLSSWQRLGLSGTIAIASARTVLQLAAVGFFFSIIFAWRNPFGVLAVLAVMLTIAALVARNRIDRSLPRLLPWLWGGILTSAALTMGYVSLFVIRPDPWYEPRYLIPLTGIVYGNAMNAAAIAGERLVSTLRNRRTEIETHLSLGATPSQAISAYRREAIKAGLIPTINQMMVVGLVTLPGIITGQLLGGAEPFTAALYQMLIMFMLAFTNLTTSALVTYGISRQFFNSALQLIDPNRPKKT